AENFQRAVIEIVPAPCVAESGAAMRQQLGWRCRPDHELPHGATDVSAHGGASVAERIVAVGAEIEPGISPVAPIGLGHIAGNESARRSEGRVDFSWARHAQIEARYASYDAVGERYPIRSCASLDDADTRRPQSGDVVLQSDCWRDASDQARRFD